jgi:histidyl-tRNA synthetase
MRDVLPDEMELRDEAIATILAVYRSYGFRRVETPALEHLALLTHSEGGENEKLIFKVLKRGERLDLARAKGVEDLADLGLRFDLTVPLARYYAHHHGELPQPLKAIQIGPVWRAERPQKGRFRQFTQCDIDILGLASETAEIELIGATLDALLALGIERPGLRINDRRILTALARRCGFPDAAHASVFIALDKLDKVGLDGVRGDLERAGHAAAAIDDLMRALAALKAAEQPLKEAQVLLAGELPDPVVEAMQRIMDAVGHAAEGRFGLAFDPTLVRGMGYYTGPIFEVAYGAYGSSIAGGGRYDAMIGKLLGRDVPASGFSIGFERIIDILKAREPRPGTRPRRVALIFDEPADHRRLFSEAGRLRRAGYLVSLEARKRNLRQQLDDLSRWGFGEYAVCPGGSPGSLELRPIQRSADG